MRLRTYGLLDDLQRLHGRTVAESGRLGERVEYGYRRDDGSFFVEGISMLVPLRPDAAKYQPLRDWTIC